MERGLAFRDLYLYQPNVSKRVIDSFSEGADALEGRLDGHEGRLGNQRKESFPHHISWEIRNGNEHRILFPFRPISKHDEFPEILRYAFLIVFPEIFFQLLNLVFLREINLGSNEIHSFSPFQFLVTS